MFHRIFEDTLAGLGENILSQLPDPANQPKLIAFRLPPLRTPDGRTSYVSEALTEISPFASLTRFETAETRGSVPVLVVMPMSGHYGILLYDLILQLLKSRTVLLLDWISPKHVPTPAGSFSFTDSIATVAGVIADEAAPVHLLGLCQSAVPALAAAALTAERAHRARPRSLALMGGPIDPAAAPTRVSMALAMTPRFLLETQILKEVPAGYPGTGRRVYAGETHQRGLLVYLARHLREHGELAAKLEHDDGSRPNRFPFLRLFGQVKDIEGEAFLSSMTAIYQTRALWTGTLEIAGSPVRPDAIRDVPLLTIEAPHDDIAAPGQTRAAHRLLAQLPADLRFHRGLSTGGHFSLLHGLTCRNEAAVHLEGFFSAAEQSDRR